MDALDVARWQFGITTVYHFIFVPLTIGLTPLVAIMQTAWYRTGNDAWLRLTKFFGKLMLINFAIGVVTGIVQEFQFGMNWSEYSRFVGDIFGAPLAMEALAAFFVESTFLGLWIFGWDRLPKRIHLACIWLVAFASNLSAFFILAANSWMQHPVGAVFNPETGRAEMVDFVAVITNNTLWVAFPHVLTGAFLTAGTFVAGIAGWWIVRAVRAGDIDLAKTVYRPAAILGLWTIIVSGAGVAISGDLQAKVMFEQQPAKMAAAEGLCVGEYGASFSVLTIGNLSNNCDDLQEIIAIPGLTSFLATGDWAGWVDGTEDVQAAFTEQFGADGGLEGGAEVSYVPDLTITYWSFRLMIGFAAFSAALAIWGLWILRRGRVTDNVWFERLCLVAIPAPFLANSFGWIFTEMGRQPWIVAPNITAGGVDQVRMLTLQGVSSVVPAGVVLASLVVFTLVYGILAVIWAKLMINYTRHGVPDAPDPIAAIPTGEATDEDSVRQLDFAY